MTQRRYKHRYGIGIQAALVVMGAYLAIILLALLFASIYTPPKHFDIGRGTGKPPAEMQQ